MLFPRRRKGRPANGASRTSHERKPLPHEQHAPKQRLPQWQAWRCSAQRVTRAWNEWLAADSGQHASFYRRYVLALADEERAALDLARAVSPGANVDHPDVSGAEWKLTTLG